MINFEMKGRLGNQMFEYAMARKIQIINGDVDELNLNFSKYVYSKGFQDDLKNFQVKEYHDVDKITITLKQKIMIFSYKVIRRIMKVFQGENYYITRHRWELALSNFFIKNGIYWLEDGYLPVQPTACKNKVVIGHFESSKNFEDIRDILLKEFEPKYPRVDKNRELYHIIESTNSVCITIRRGDFVENEKFREKFYVCNNDYFYRALEVLKGYVESPTFIIFSDDIEWVKANMTFPGDVYYEDGTDPVWEKLRLMKLCKHFILSNSTFSFWAQCLSENPDKVVISPRKWHNKSSYDEIQEDHWILI